MHHIILQDMRCWC